MQHIFCPMRKNYKFEHNSWVGNCGSLDVLLTQFLRFIFSHFFRIILCLLLLYIMFVVVIECYITFLQRKMYLGTAHRTQWSKKWVAGGSRESKCKAAIQETKWILFKNMFWTQILTYYCRILIICWINIFSLVTGNPHWSRSQDVHSSV